MLEKVAALSLARALSRPHRGIEEATIRCSISYLAKLKKVRTVEIGNWLRKETS